MWSGAVLWTTWRFRCTPFLERSWHSISKLSTVNNRQWCFVQIILIYLPIIIPLLSHRPPLRDRTVFPQCLSLPNWKSSNQLFFRVWFISTSYYLTFTKVCQIIFQNERYSIKINCEVVESIFHSFVVSLNANSKPQTANIQVVALTRSFTQAVNCSNIEWITKLG